jgi:hypothetical protein
MEIQFSSFCFGSVFSSFLLKVVKGFLVIGAAPIFWELWKTKNKSCFKCICPGDPTTVVLYVCQFLTSWATFAERGSLRTVAIEIP